MIDSSWFEPWRGANQPRSCCCSTTRNLFPRSFPSQRRGISDWPANRVKRHTCKQMRKSLQRAPGPQDKALLNPRNHKIFLFFSHGLNLLRSVCSSPRRLICLSACLAVCLVYTTGLFSTAERPAPPASFAAEHGSKSVRVTKPGGRCGRGGRRRGRGRRRAYGR